MSEIKTPVAKATLPLKKGSDKKDLKVDILDQKGKVAGQLDLDANVFGQDVNTYLIHAVAVAQQNNARQGTKSTLTRSEVRGLAKKPYRQKGTGNARQGSKKAPHHDGGGVAFAPKPRDFSQKVNKKQRHAAFVSALSGKFQDKELIVIKDTKLDAAKTKNVVKLVEALVKAKIGVTEKSRLLFVTENIDTDFVRAVANIERAEVTTASQLSVLDVVTCKFVIASVAAIKSIEEANK